MVSKALVTETREVVDQLKARYGELSLAMLRSTSWDPHGHWDFVVSGEWMNARSRKDTIGLIIKLIRKHVSKSNWNLISTVAVLETDDSFVQMMSFNYPELSGSGTFINVP